MCCVLVFVCPRGVVRAGSGSPAQYLPHLTTIYPSAKQVADPYTVLIREKKLPLSLLEDPEKKGAGGRAGGRVGGGLFGVLCGSAARQAVLICQRQSAGVVLCCRAVHGGQLGRLTVAGSLARVEECCLAQLCCCTETEPLTPLTPLFSSPWCRQGDARQPGADAALCPHLWQAGHAQAPQAGCRLLLRPGAAGAWRNVYCWA